jgi:hypothetical protein
LRHASVSPSEMVPAPPQTETRVSMSMVFMMAVSGATRLPSHFEALFAYSSRRCEPQSRENRTREDGAAVGIAAEPAGGEHCRCRRIERSFASCASTATSSALQR